MAYDAELWKAVGLALLALVVIQMGPRIIVKLWMRLFAATYERHLRERPPVSPVPASSSPPPIVRFARGFAQGFSDTQAARIADAYCRGREDGYKQGMIAGGLAQKKAAAAAALLQTPTAPAWRNHHGNAAFDDLAPREIQASGSTVPYRPRNEG